MEEVPVQKKINHRHNSGSLSLTPRQLPFVGRSKEINRVADFLQSAISGDELALLWLQGEAGVGKSRFLKQVQITFGEQDNLVLYVRLYPDSAMSIVQAFGAAVAAHPRLRQLLPNCDVQNSSMFD